MSFQSRFPNAQNILPHISTEHSQKQISKLAQNMMTDTDWKDIEEHAEEINEAFESQPIEDMANDVISDDELKKDINESLKGETTGLVVTEEDQKHMNDLKEKAVAKLNRERRQKALIEAYLRNYCGEFYERHRFYPDGHTKRQYRRKLERMSREGQLKEVDLNK